MLLFLKSMGFGVAVAAPVGPMSLICMRRTLDQGWKQGIATGAGIALSDATYALLAALGLSRLLDSGMGADPRLLRLGAGLILAGIGALGCLQRSSRGQPAAENAGLAAAFWSGFALTLANPPTLFVFAAIFAAFAHGAGFDDGTIAETVCGVFIGSLIWWLGLTTVIARLRHSISPATRRRIGLVSSACLLAFGLFTIASAL